MADFLLKNVDWAAALTALDKVAERNERLSFNGIAQLYSLAASYSPDFQIASRRLREACRREPLNPLHEFRKVLLLAKFGQTSQAAVALERLKKLLPQTPPLVDYLRALLILRSGRADQARSIAKTLETTHPKFAYAKFLKAEAQIVLSNKASSIEKHIIDLPVGAEFDSLWADILTKIALFHPKDGPKQAQKYLEKKITAGSSAYNVVKRAISWANASLEELAQYLERELPNSRAEEIILSCLLEQLKQKKNNEKAIKTLSALSKRYPNRSAVKQIRNVFITRLAMEKSAVGDYEQAVRLIEHCLREQPYDPINFQNLAALFTLLREKEPYHDAWAWLNRHQYRMISLGVSDREILMQTARTHRLFAQQARGYETQGLGANRTIFRQTVSDELDQTKRLSINHDEILADSELLRQWIYHSSAEIVFQHCLLLDNPQKFFLYPIDYDEAAARSEGLKNSAEALSILVPGEGAVLEDKLTRQWRKIAEKINTNYNAPKAVDDKVWQLQVHHLNLLGELTLFCLGWQPEPSQTSLAEELLNFINSEKVFFDEKVIYRFEKEARGDIYFPVQLLIDHFRTTLGLETDTELTPERRAVVFDSLTAELLLRLSVSAYNREGSQKDCIDRALSYLDRARTCNPANANIELKSAQILSLGDFYDEAQTCLRRFYRYVDQEDQELLSEAEKLEQTLKEKRKETSSQKRDIYKSEDILPEKSEARLIEIERELERAPASWRLYEEMVQELIKAKQFEDAIIWADRAVAHCLTRESQINARALAIEARGLEILSKEFSKPAILYMSGAHEPARKAIQSLSSQQLDYKLLFLLGKCELANEDPDKAQETFRKAMNLCESQLHRTVLRYLTENIDNAYLTVARNSVNTALQEGSLEEAVMKAAAQFARLKEPAAWLLDFARVFYSVALIRSDKGHSDFIIPQINIDATWSHRLNQALLENSNLDRALALAELAESVHSEASAKAQTLKKRIQILKRQFVMSESLGKAGQLLVGKKFKEVIAYLEQLEEDVANEFRFIRIRVLALLGLNRFDDADTIIKESAENSTSEFRIFIEEYPNLAFRQRLAAARLYLQEAEVEVAAAVLANAEPTNSGQAADLAYCHAFGLVIHGYQLRRERQEDKVCEQFLQAMNLLESHLNHASHNNQPHITELYDKLEKELDNYDRT